MKLLRLFEKLTARSRNGGRSFLGAAPSRVQWIGGAACLGAGND